MTEREATWPLSCQIGSLVQVVMVAVPTKWVTFPLLPRGDDDDDWIIVSNEAHAICQIASLQYLFRHRKHKCRQSALAFGFTGALFVIWCIECCLSFPPVAEIFITFMSKNAYTDLFPVERYLDRVKKKLVNNWQPGQALLFSGISNSHFVMMTWVWASKRWVLFMTVRAVW